MGPPPWGAHRPGLTARAVLFLSRHTPLGRGKARRLMLSLFSDLHRGPADVRLFGAPARLHPVDNHAERRALINPARYDRAERDFVIAGLQGPDPVYVDVGANFGLYVLDAVLRAPRARILAVEPQRELLERLAVNLTFLETAGHDAVSRIVFVAAAAGAEDGALTLQANADASVRALTEGADGETVPVRPLLTILADARIDRIDVLKIDIEGWEDRAIAPFAAGAPDTLLPRRIVIEHALRRLWLSDCVAQLQARGYRVAGTTRANTLLQLG